MMKRHSTSSAILSLMAVCSSPDGAFAWSLLRNHHPSSSSTSHPSFSHLLPTSLSTTRLHTTAVVTEDDASSATTATTAPTSSSLPKTEEEEPEKGTVVAEGVVVARFAGGLTAVRVLDDMTASQTDRSASAATGDDLQGRNVMFPDGSVGVVVAHRPPVLFVFTAAQGNDSTIDAMEGTVQILDSQMQVMVPEDVLRATTNTDTSPNKSRAMFSKIPQVSDIALINHPMLTGVTAFEALAPIGRGQNMMFVGHNVDSMRRYAIDFVANQVSMMQQQQCNDNNNNQKMGFVYAAIDDPASVHEMLQDQGIQESVHVVAPQTTFQLATTEEVDEMSVAADAVATAAKACAIAESLALEEGAHTLVVVDTIDMHKKLWDGTTRVLVDVFGVDAVVRGDREGGASSEMRAFFSTLVQRAAQYNARRGGGSVTLLLLTQIPRSGEQGSTVFQKADFDTASDKVKDRIQLLTGRNIPLTADNLRKIDIPIPSVSEGRRRLALQHVDDLISMSDGQLWLDEKLEAAGQFPPIDPQRSITRVGIGADTESRADAPALRRVVEGLRLILSQAAHMDGAEANAASKKQVQRQKAFLLAMHQTSGRTGGRRLSESCAALLAASQGALDDAVDAGALAGTEKGETVIQGLLEHLQSSIPEIMRETDESLDLSEENKQRLAEAIDSFMNIGTLVE